MRYVVLALGGVATFAIAGVALIWHYLNPKDMDTEIAKSLLSILTASVVTQAIAVVIYQYNESRKVQAEKDAFRARVLDRLNEAFVKIKGLRRRVRAQAVATSTEQEAEMFAITRSVYQDALEEVNDIQLSLEIVAKDVETNANVLRYAKEIFQGVRTMEEYLNEMVDEWEHLHAKFEGDPPTARTSIVPKFNDLLGAYKTSQFRPLFVHAYYETIENVRASMTDRGTLRWQILYGPHRTSGHS